MSDTTPSNPLNILYCEGNTDGTVGGSFFSLLYLVAGLDRNKYRPVVVFHNEHALLEQYHQAGVETLIIPRPKPLVFRQPSSAMGRLLFPFAVVIQKLTNFIKFFPVTAFQYTRLIRKYNISLLHLNNSIIRNNDWMFASQLTGVKCVTHERGINQYYSSMARYYARKLDAIICISNAVRENLREKSIDPGNLVTIYNGIDPEVVKVDLTEKEIRKKHDIKDSSTLIGVIGNIKEWKGQETIVKSMPAILKRHPDTVCLLVGDTARDDQYYKDRLLTLIDQLGIQDHIVFTGYTKNVADYLNAMQVVLHTSIDPEPFGRVLIEAMSVKKAVIGTRAGAVPEIIAEGETGYTYPPGDDQALSKAVISVLASPEKATEMGLAGYQRLMEQFHISVNIEKTQVLYDRLLN